MTFVDYTVVPKQEIKHEEALALDISSSPYGSASMMSSRRDSLVSSTNYSTASSFGSADSYTPSYASFGDNNMPGMTPNVSFADPLCLGSNITDYDMSFMSPHCLPQQALYPLDDGSATDISGLRFDIHICMDGSEPQHSLYNARNGITQENSFLTPPSTPVGSHSIYGNTIIPGETYHHIYDTVTPSFPVYPSPIHEQKRYEQNELLGSLDPHYSLDDIHSQLSTGRSRSKRQAHTSVNVKKEKPNQATRTRASIKPKDRSKTPRGQYECPWEDKDDPICGKVGRRFERKEHMTRHLKQHITSSLKDIKQKTSDMSYWKRLLPHLRVAEESAKKSIGNLLALRRDIPEEVLKQIFGSKEEGIPEIFSYHELLGQPYYNPSYIDIDEIQCRMCKEDGKVKTTPTRRDNLTQHIVKVHIEPAPNSQPRAYRCWKQGMTADSPLRELLDWDRLARFEWTRLAEACCEKQEREQLDLLNLGLPSHGTPGVRRERKRVNRSLRKRSSSPLFTAESDPAAAFNQYAG